MAREASSDEEDYGRKESEKQLKNSKTKFLEEVLDQTQTDYDDIIDSIEEHRASAATNQETHFLNTLRTILPDDSTSSITNRTTAIKSLLTASSTLLKIHKKANRAISDSNNSSYSCSAYEQARTEDQERVKQILLAGKRVFEGDLAAIEQHARAKEAGGKSEAALQAVEMFGDGAVKVDKASEAGNALRYLDKGVRKMVKGMGPEV